MRQWRAADAQKARWGKDRLTCRPRVDVSGAVCEKGRSMSPKRCDAARSAMTVIVLVGVLLAVGGLDQARAQAKPEGEMRWALYVTMPPAWFDPGEVTGTITPFWVLYALHDALVKPMPGQPHDPQPGRVVDGERRSARLRVQAARGREVPQRRSLHRGGREVQLPARQGHQDPAREGQGGRGRRSPPGALPAARAVARLHDLLRHPGQRRGLDRPQEAHRAGGRRGLPQAAHRPRSLQVREPHARRGAGHGGQRELLAQDALREAAGLTRWCPRPPPGWPC